MSLRIIFTALIIGPLLAACHDGHYESTEYYYEETVQIEPLPELNYFAVIDSFGTHSDIERGDPLILSPYVDGGYFELEWDVSPNITHHVELSINDRPTPTNSLTLSSAWCGPLELCQSNSFQACFYNSDLSIECAQPESNVSYLRRDISALINTLPEQLYLILEVCDNQLSYCEYRSEAITVE